MNTFEEQVYDLREEEKNEFQKKKVEINIMEDVNINVLWNIKFWER